MKILFVSFILPTNSGSGAAIRSYQLYQELRSFADVDVLLANDCGVSLPVLEKFKTTNTYIGHIEITYWKSPTFGISNPLNKNLSKILNERHYDYVFIRYHYLAYWLGAFKLKNLILDCDDCFIELLQQRVATYTKLEKLLTSFENYCRCQNYIKDIAKVPLVIFSKPSSAIDWQDNFLIIPNKIEPTKNNFPTREDNNFIHILFIGVLNYAPNFQSLDDFIENVWPLVISKRTNITLKIVGRDLFPHYQEKWLSFKGIEYLGFVEDIEEVYEDIDFSIVPIYYGSGTHIKIMESLIRAKTLVITKLAHRGYENTLLDNESLLIANNNEEFAENIIRLVDNSELRKKLALHGQSQVEKYHTIKKDSLQLKEILLGENV